MTTGKDVYALLRKLADTASHTEKEAILKDNINFDLFWKVAKAALDPYVTYGIAKTPEREFNGVLDLGGSVGVWELLDALAQRNLTGGAALARVKAFFEAMNSESAEVLRRIIIKDLRCGVTDKTLNKIWKGFIPSFDCMLAHPYEEKRVKQWPQAVEPKIDGFRSLAFVNPKAGEVKFFTRSGKEYTTFEHLKPEVLKVFDIDRIFNAFPHTALPADSHPLTKCGDPDQMIAVGSIVNTIFGWRDAPKAFVLDGEVASGSFNKTASELRRKDEQATDATFYVFDAVPMEVFNESTAEDPRVIYRHRRLIIDGILTEQGSRVQSLPLYLVHGHNEIMDIYRRVRDRGLEGLIVKNLDAPYVKKRDHAWMKIKGEETIDVRITGWFEGKTGTKLDGKFGGYLVDVDGVEVRVGGGYKDEQREDFLKDAMSPPLREIAFENGVKKTYWATPGRLIEVEYHEKTPDGSLRHPRFVRFRDDKDKGQEAAE